MTKAVPFTAEFLLLNVFTCCSIGIGIAYEVEKLLEHSKLTKTVQSPITESPFPIPLSSQNNQ